MAPRGAIVLGLLILYLVWGSTYLAVRWVVEELPPFLSAGVRFVLAGSLIWGFFRLGRGLPAATPRQWAVATGLGALFMLGGNGMVVWAETRVSSGVAALMVALVPAWIALLEAVFLRARLGAARVVGLFLGLVGLAMLVGPGPDEAGRVDPWGAAALVVSTCCWATGSILSRTVKLPGNAVSASGMEMIGGGILLLIAGSFTGEIATFAPAEVSLQAILAFGWLLVGGSLVGFTIYAWLLEASTPAIATTYAYVNPLVAVALGAWLANEAVGPRIGLAGGLILAAVLLITRGAR